MDLKDSWEETKATRRGNKQSVIVYLSLNAEEGKLEKQYSCFPFVESLINIPKSPAFYSSQFWCLSSSDSRSPNIHTSIILERKVTSGKSKLGESLT